MRAVYCTHSLVADCSISVLYRRDGRDTSGGNMTVQVGVIDVCTGWSKQSRMPCYRNVQQQTHKAHTLQRIKLRLSSQLHFVAVLSVNQYQSGVIGGYY